MLHTMSSTRRELLGALAAASLYGKPAPEPHQATGLKIGEVTPESAVIWTRRTSAPFRLDNGVRRRGHGKDASILDPDLSADTLEGASPGGNGYVRLTIEPVSGRGKKRVESWTEVDPTRDFVHQFRLAGLQPATHYRFSVESKESRSRRADGALTGSFRTAPPPGLPIPVEFALSSCQMYCRMDREDGFWIYDALEKLKPAFLVSCGDNVYYDSEDPIVNSEAAARYHWARMYSLPTLSSCLRALPGYWQKDDHDTVSDDCWPGLKPPRQAPFTFERGQPIFREQTPSPIPRDPLYRRFRWGADLEVWLPEARDYRSANTMPDGPAKTIWGTVQKQWLKDTLEKSTARWKIIVNPDPVIGPDHKRKNDNHADPAFATEGREIRRWLRSHVEGHVILMNGDRHWQYHSVDPETGLHEFGCGPASDAHAVPPSEGEDKRYHRFLRIKGGFVYARVNPGKDNPLVIEHRDVKGRVVNQAVFGGRG